MSTGPSVVGHEVAVVAGQLAILRAPRRLDEAAPSSFFRPVIMLDMQPVNTLATGTETLEISEMRLP
jgi:hypothetical protein